MKPSFIFLAPLLLAAAPGAHAQNLDLGSAPGSAPVPIRITASGGISWSQDASTVTASGNAVAVRGDVTVQADQLVAHYVNKPGSSGSPANLDAGGGTLTELDAIGHVHIFTPTDNAWGDHAVYSLSAQVLVLTGQHLKLTTQHDVITARDSVEYYSASHKAIARGNALIVADDGRSIAADVITGYLAANATPAPTQVAAGGDELASAGSLQRVEAVGHVRITTPQDSATGDSGVYLPPTGQARLGGNVHIIHGPNELAGSDALVNMKTGIATLLAAPGGQVSGVIVPGSGGPQ